MGTIKLALHKLPHNGCRYELCLWDDEEGVRHLLVQRKEVRAEDDLNVYYKQFKGRRKSEATSIYIKKLRHYSRRQEMSRYVNLQVDNRYKWIIEFTEYGDQWAIGRYRSLSHPSHDVKLFHNAGMGSKEYHKARKHYESLLVKCVEEYTQENA